MGLGLFLFVPIFVVFWNRLKKKLDQMAIPVYNPKISPGSAIINIPSKKLSCVEEKSPRTGAKIFAFTKTGSSCRHLQNSFSTNNLHK